MKKAHLTLIVSMFSACIAIGQEKALMKQDMEITGAGTLTYKEAEVIQPANKITVLSSEGDQKTLVIHDMNLRMQVFQSSEKRDMLTALPGFVSLGTIENGLRVTIKNEYINKYLLEHLGVKEADLSNIK